MFGIEIDMRGRFIESKGRILCIIDDFDDFYNQYIDAYNNSRLRNFFKIFDSENILILTLTLCFS